MNEIWKEIIVVAINAVVTLVTVIKQSRKTRKEVKNELNTQTEIISGTSNGDVDRSGSESSAGKENISTNKRGGK